MALFHFMGNWFKDAGSWLSKFVAGNNGSTVGFDSPNSAMQFFSLNGEIQWQRLCSYVDYHRLLHKASPVAAVFNKRANMFANGQVETLNRESRKYVRGANKEWERLIERPNPLQTKTVFLKQLHKYVDVFGWCYAFKVTPVGYNVPSKLFLLPPWLLTVERIRQPFISLTDSDTIRKVYLDWDGVRTELKEEDLILFTDTLSCINEDTLLPEGRLKELENPLTLTLSAYEALATLLQRKGALGILSNESEDQIGSVNLLEDEKAQLQDEFRRYGLSRDQFQVIITNTNMRWQPMGMNVKELMILETLELAKMDICDVYNFPYELMSSAKGNTFANKEEAKKSAYQDATIPESKSIMEQLNAGLKTEPNNIEYVINYEDVEVLQSSIEVREKAKSARLDRQKKEWELGTITRNDIRQENGRDIIGTEVKTWPDDVKEEFNKFKMIEDAESAEKQAKMTNNGNVAQ